MKLVSILRHAKSSWKDASLDDHDRPLAPRGQRDLPRMGRLIAGREDVPELILSSTARRARDTALAVAEACGRGAEVRLLPGLYLAPAATYLEVLAALPDGIRHVLLVGHNPGLEELVESLVGGDRRMPTCALAEVALPLGSWRELPGRARGELRGLWLPRDLAES